MGGFSRSSSKPRDMTPREFMALRGPLASQLGNLTAQGGLPQPTGPLSAPLGSSEEQILQQLMSLTSGTSPEMQTALDALRTQAGGVTNPFAGAAGIGAGELVGLSQLAMLGFGGSSTAGAQDALLQDFLGGGGLSPETNPFLRAAIDAATRPILENFGLENQALRSQFSAAGQSTGRNASSPFEMALARASSGAANAVGDTAGRLSFGAFENERARQLQALGLAQTGDQNAFSRALQATEAMSLPRLIADADLTRRASAFESSQDRAQSAATALPQLERAQIDNVLANLEAQALPRLIEELGIERGLQAFTNQQNSLLELLRIAAGISSPTVANQQRGSNPLLGALGTAAGTAIGGPVGGAIGGGIAGVIGG